jgi:beta-mannosidase
MLRMPGYEASLFADVMATCDGNGECFIRNDGIRPFNGRLALNATDFATGQVRTVLDRALAMPAGAGVIEWLHSNAVAAIDGRTHVLEAVVTDVSGSVVSANVVPFATPGEMQLPDASLSVTAVRGCAGGVGGGFVAEVRGSAVAMYATLTTQAQGRFEKNAFLFRPPVQAVRFFPFGNLTSEASIESDDRDLDNAWNTFAESLRVEDVSCYRYIDM